MSYESIDCVDAGTDYCPCYLAETNNCIICSQLQGKEFCDCINWKGVCIYQEYIWNGSKGKQIRESLSVNVIEKNEINEKVLFLKLKVSKTLARELNQPGSYIFIRDEKYPQFFDVPMSVMYSDETDGMIDLLIQIRGIKTKVLNKIGETLKIRAPYWNGVIGLKNLKAVAGQNCLIVARGISQAPSVLVAKKLKASNNNIKVLLDEGSSGTSYSKKYYEKLGCDIIKAEILKNKIFDETARQIIKNIIRDFNIKFIFSGGSDIIHKEILNIIKETDDKILFACTNNANICCGEGICGSCSIRLKDRRSIKACKAQVDPNDLIGR